MTQEQLTKANILATKIREFKSSLCCFEIDYDGVSFDTNPELIIEFDDCDDDRRQIKIPMVLNNTLVEFLKSEIKAGLLKAQTEFDNL